MRYQNTNFNCGPAALANALEVYGKKVTQEAIAAIAKTTTEGTDEAGLIRATKKNGFVPYKIRMKIGSVAFNDLWIQLGLGRPVILCVDKWTHWVAAVGLVGRKVIISDPAYDDYVKYMSEDDLLTWWGYKKRFNGFIISDVELANIIT